MYTAKQSTSSTYSAKRPRNLQLSKSEYVDLYYYMRLNRSLENRLSVLYRQNRVVGGLYLSLGQEATSVGSARALSGGDYLAPMIRNLGSILVRGVKPVEILLQYLARATSPTGGKDGNLHFGSITRGIISPVSLLGDLVPVMAGMALILKVKSKPNVALTYIGDGGASTGAFHEGLNFAAVRRVPMILILENNLYAYSTPVEKQTNVTNFVKRAEAYGIYGEAVDGNDVLAVYDCVLRARELCLKGEGPVLIESKTFRRSGHAAHDDASYVPQETRKKWEMRDPLDGYVRFLLGESIADESEIEQLNKRIEEEIEQSVEEALAAPFPDPHSTLTDVYFNS